MSRLELFRRNASKRKLTHKEKSPQVLPQPRQLSKYSRALITTLPTFASRNGKPKTLRDVFDDLSDVDGQKTTIIELTAESTLLTAARLKNNQIISYVELLNVPRQNNTPLNIELKHYAIRRVMETKARPKQMPHCRRGHWKFRLFCRGKYLSSTPTITPILVVLTSLFRDFRDSARRTVKSTVASIFYTLNSKCRLLRDIFSL